MSTVKEIEAAVKKLSRKQFQAFRKWFAEFELRKARESKAAAWDKVNEFRKRLATPGRSFSDSADLIREDRGR